MQANLLPALEPLDSRVLLSSSGALDPAFNNGRLLNTTFKNGESVISDVAALPDGGIIAAGTVRLRHNGAITGGTEMTLVKYQFDGSLDPTFGAGGVIEATP